jgi:hypothetical protein
VQGAGSHATTINAGLNSYVFLIDQDRVAPTRITGFTFDDTAVSFTNDGTTHQAVNPLYAWGNSLPTLSNSPVVTSPTCFQEGTQRPGYVPYADPFPIGAAGYPMP